MVWVRERCKRCARRSLCMSMRWCYTTPQFFPCACKAHGAQVAVGRKASWRDVENMRTEGLSEDTIRQNLKKRGVSKSRIAGLIKDTRPAPTARSVEVQQVLEAEAAAEEVDARERRAFCDAEMPVDDAASAFNITATALAEREPSIVPSEQEEHTWGKQVEAAAFHERRAAGQSNLVAALGAAGARGHSGGSCACCARCRYRQRRSQNSFRTRCL